MGEGIGLRTLGLDSIVEGLYYRDIHLCILLSPSCDTNNAKPALLPSIDPQILP